MIRGLRRLFYAPEGGGAFGLYLFWCAAVCLCAIPFAKAHGAYRFSDYRARPPIHLFGAPARAPMGMSPAEVKAAYGLPASGGQGTIAIIGAYDDPLIEKSLGVFNKTFGLRACATRNKCFEKHRMKSGIGSDSGWAMEGTLDVEWAHAIAPNAHILLVEAETPSGPNLLKAVDYAVHRPDVVAVSMSWGGAEFREEVNLDTHFKSKTGAIFFAASGDNGWGASWPAASPFVIGVGGTSLAMATTSGSSGIKETAWAGSGGGVSAYEKQPAYQSSYVIARSKGMRAIPDVAYNADPRSGFSIYRAADSGINGWYVVGGTSAGAPQWAAIQSLGLSVSLARLYADKALASYANFFRDIVGGSNGDCAYYCHARKHYDYITGLGAPLAVRF